MSESEMARLRDVVLSRGAEIERLRGAYEQERQDCLNLTEKVIPNLRADIKQLRGLLRDARDDVADCMAREVKPRRIAAYKLQLAAIDEALGE